MNSKSIKSENVNKNECPIHSSDSIRYAYGKNKIKNWVWLGILLRCDVFKK